MAHEYEWRRTELADAWLGFTAEQVADHLAQSRLQDYGYALLGTE